MADLTDADRAAINAATKRVVPQNWNHNITARDKSVYLAGVAAERERCALICEAQAEKYSRMFHPDDETRRLECLRRAAAIRSTGNG